MMEDKEFVYAVLAYNAEQEEQLKIQDELINELEKEVKEIIELYGPKEPLEPGD